MERYEIVIPVKCNNIRTVHPGPELVKDYRCVQCTEASLVGIIDHGQHRNKKETVFMFSLSTVPVKVIM